jgi:hypothetical protein
MEPSFFEAPQEQPPMTPLSFLDTLGTFLRYMGTGLGLFLIILGLVYTLKIFYLLYEGLQAPQSYKPLIQEWGKLAGAGEPIEIVIGGKTYSLSSLIGIGILGGGLILLLLITTGFMSVGAKIVALTSSDREAVKRILRYTLGMVREYPPITTSPPSRDSLKNASVDPLKKGSS